jgi:hypothetical protein
MYWTTGRVHLKVSFVKSNGKHDYLFDFMHSPDICRQTGGRKATKTQRRLAYSIHEDLQRYL